ncbi:unnamed protein product, partial [Ostreobium quekettii]|eukprot:evm.model.scf_1302.1 EVM.evm.TU.scf_1302.1   scf_1302:349-2885(-)
MVCRQQKNIALRVVHFTNRGIRICCLAPRTENCRYVNVLVPTLPMTTLQTELTWLLEDSVVALDKFHGDPIAPLDETQWRSARQQELHATHQAGSLTGQGSVNEQGKVLMRLNMEDLNDLWRKRVKERVPIQYITHTAHWRDLVLAVGPGVLVPRPETELIIDFVADVLDAHPGLRHCPWADLGTGSGALAIGLAKLLCRPSSVWAVDLSPIAVRYAKFNVARCDAASAVHVMEGSWFKPLANFRGKLGGVVCNPPYIPSGVLGGLQAEVRQHEPQLALDGGAEEGKGRLQ